jgi:hypothetical protein
MKHDQFGFGFHESASPITTKVIRRCFEDHKALKVGKYEIYGGSCSRPIVKDADIYVGLDHSMSFSGSNYPWEDNHTVEFQYLITDMAAPKDPASFKKLIHYLAAELTAGKKVHVGCIGGHGRTGTVLSALVKVMTGEADATTYVREHYCKKAVESKSQIAFLKKHFGITPAKPTKDYAPSMWKNARKPGDFYSGKKKAKGKIARANKKEFVVSPMGANDIWGTYLDNEI